MAFTGEIIKISPKKQDPSLALPDIGFKERDFKSRRQFLNARARAAGYENYNDWLKARRAVGVPKGTGGRRPDLYGIILQDYRINQGGVDLKSIKKIERDSKNISEREALEGLKDAYNEFLIASEEDKIFSYNILSCQKFYNMTEDEVINYFKRNPDERLVALSRRDNLIQTAYKTVEEHQCRNLDEFIKSIESYTRKEII